MDDKESLRKALKGAYAVFSLTNYWDHMDPERETTQGINVADVAAVSPLCDCLIIYSPWLDFEKLIRIYTFSGARRRALDLFFAPEHHRKWDHLPLPDLAACMHAYTLHIQVLTRYPDFLVSNGRYTCVPHFNSKAKVESYIRDKLPNLPSTFFLAGCYMTNFSGPFSGVMFPYDPATNSYTFTLPIPHTAACIPIFEAYHDTGKFVKAILTKRDQTLGKRVLGATKYASAQELADEFERVRGIKASAVFVPTDQWKLKAWEPAREEMAQSMEMMGTTGYYGHESLDWSLSVSPSLYTMLV